MDKDPMESWKTADVFPDPLWRGHYPGDLTALQEKTIEFLKNSVKLNAGLERGGGASSSSEDEMPHVWPEAVDFYKWCQPPSHEIWCHWNYKNPEKRQIDRSWANYHVKGAWTDEHTHGETDQVIVLYLDAPPNSGNLEVHNPLFYHWEGTKRISGSNTWTKVPVKTGDVIIFPGWLLHRTEKNATDSPRITINTNITTSSTPIHRDRITPSLGEYIS